MKTIIKTDKAPAPIGPYNQAVLVNGTLYMSGQVAIDPVTNELIEGTVEDEAKQVMKNLEAVLQAANMSFEHVVKTTIFLKDMNDFATVNKVYGSYFNEANAPARETVAVRHLPKFVSVEIAMIAIE